MYNMPSWLLLSHYDFRAYCLLWYRDITVLSCRGYRLFIMPCR